LYLMKVLDNIRQWSKCPHCSWRSKKTSVFALCQVHRTWQRVFYWYYRSCDENSYSD
jgi:hypothetical protein